MSMEKIVQADIRNTTVTLDGSECAVTFYRPFRYYEVFNQTDTEVYVSVWEGLQPDEDGVLTIPAGVSATLAHMKDDADTVFIVGTGKVQVAAKNNGEAVFKLRAKGGGGSSGNGDYENVLKNYSESSQGLYSDSAKSKRTMEINANSSSGFLSLTNSHIALKAGDITDISSTVEINSAAGIKLNGKPLTFGRYRDSDKMVLSDNFIQANGTLNISPISDNPSAVSKIRLKPSNGGIELSKVVSTYEKNASAAGEGAIAIGSSASASGSNSIAVGTHAEASGSSSIAVGNTSYMGNWYFYTKASGDNAIAVGQGIKTGSNSQAAFGKFNQNNEYDLFEVGYGSYSFPSGSYSEVRKNALSVDTNGTVTVDKAVVSGGHLVLNNGLDIMSSNADVQASIVSSIYQIVKHIADLRHMTITSSTYSNSVFMNPDVEEFSFVMKAYVMAYYITVKRFPINLRSPSSIRLVFSWLDSDTSAVTEHKCLIEIGNQLVADPMTCTVVCSS